MKAMQRAAHLKLSNSPSALKAAERAKKRQWESMESRKVAYKRLTEMSEEKDIGQLMNIFMEREDKNFSSFGYSNKLKDDVEKLKQQISDLQVCPFASPFSQTVLLGWGGFFLSALPSTSARSRARLASCRAVGRREGKGQPTLQVRQAERCGRQSAAAREPKVSQCCRRVPATSTAGASRAERCLSCGHRLPSWPADSGLRGVKWVGGPQPLVNSDGRSASAPSLCLCSTDQNFSPHHGSGACREEQHSGSEGAGGMEGRISLCKGSRALS